MVKMKVSVKRKLSLKIKEGISKIILFFLYRGLNIIYKYDETLKKEIDSLNYNYKIKLQLSSNCYSLNLVKDKYGFKKIRNKRNKRNKSNIDDSDLEICFKNIDIAFLVLIGNIGISNAYAMHSFTLKGSINEGLKIVRCIEIVEAYLFPKFITKKILKEVPKRKINILSTYIHILINK